MNRKLNLKNPQTFNEKLQWLKLYDRKNEYVQMVDKYLVKELVKEALGEEYIIPTLAVWERPEDIDFTDLPNQFVIKWNHDSGSVVVCKDKNTFDCEVAIRKLKKHNELNGYWFGRERPYKKVKPRIIAEKYMEDPVSGELRDYKFFCFNGKVKCFKVDFDRFIEHRANYYNEKGVLLPFGEALCPPKPEKELILPDEIPQMIMFAETLAKNIPFVRIDFYDVNGKIYFGEITFFPASGFGSFTPEEWDFTLGRWLSL